MARACLTRAALVAAALILPPLPAGAEYPVIDATAIEKATQQLNKLQQQLDVLNETRDKIQAQINAIGKMGQIAVPMVNMARMQRQLQRDALCLLPDWKKLLPDVDFEDVNWSTICEAGAAYRQSLWVNPEDLMLQDVPQRVETQRGIRDRRINILVDATSKGLAQADLVASGAVDLSEAAGELDAAAKAATDMNDRLAVIAQGQVLSARAKERHRR